MLHFTGIEILRHYFELRLDDLRSVYVTLSGATVAPKHNAANIMTGNSNRFSLHNPITSPSFTPYTFDKLFANRMTCTRTSCRVNFVSVTPSI